MKQTFKISRIDGGVFAREVNPYGNSFLSPAKMYNEYQLTEDTLVYIWSKSHSAYWRVGAKGYTDYRDTAWMVPISTAERIVNSSPEKDAIEYPFNIGDIITGELLNENGVTKIKI